MERRDFKMNAKSNETEITVQNGERTINAVEGNVVVGKNIAVECPDRCKDFKTGSG
jgi:hypothetical protein